MNYNIKGTGMSVTDELREYIEKRLSHADKFLADDPTALTEIELAFAEHNESGHYRAEFMVSASNNIFRAQKWGTTMHEAIDLAAAELTGELQRSKKKKLKIFRHSAVKVKEFLRGWRRDV